MQGKITTFLLNSLTLDAIVIPVFVLLVGAAWLIYGKFSTSEDD